MEKVKLLQVINVDDKKEATFLDTEQNRYDLGLWLWPEEDGAHILDSQVFNIEEASEVDWTRNELREVESSSGTNFIVRIATSEWINADDLNEEFDPELITIDALRCESCGEWLWRELVDVFEHEDWMMGLAEEWSLNPEAVICVACEQHDKTQTDATVTMVGTRGHSHARFGAYFADFDDDSSPESSEMADFCRELTGSWHSSDGWRGHFHLDTTSDTYELVDDGWTTGWADDMHARKDDFNDLMMLLIDQSEKGTVGDDMEDKIDFVAFICTAITSNVFSTAISIYVHKEHRADFEKWLMHHGASFEDIHHQLT